VEALTSLSLRGDATLAEYMEHLKALAGQLRGAEAALGVAHAALAAKDEALAAAGAEAANLRTVGWRGLCVCVCVCGCCVCVCVCVLRT
jgi:hypothetical protein